MTKCNSTDAIASKQTKKRATDTKSFIARAIEVHGDRYDYSKVAYVNSSLKLTIICSLHGEFNQISYSHLSGCGCPRCAREKTGRANSDTQESFIAKANKLHGGKYTYDNVVYKNSIDHISITCQIHGDFRQSSANHLAGNGCPKCAHIATASKKVINFDEVVARALVRHGARYSYSRASFISAKHKMTITCKVHGAFKMNVSKHLSGGNCQKCAREGSGHSLTNFKIACSRNNNSNGILYVIECHSKNEFFYKIGITSRSVAKRFKNQSVIPYEIKEVFIIEESPTYIFKLEKRLHRLLARFQHEPSMKFEGHTECFKTIRPIKKLMKELESTDQLQLLA